MPEVAFQQGKLRTRFIGQRFKPSLRSGKRHVILIDADEHSFRTKALGHFQGMPCPTERGIHEYGV